MPLFLMIARVPPGGLDDFDSYETSVLPLLADHGGQLERRVRSTDGGTEAHLVFFGSDDGFAAYRADPRRAAAAQQLAASGASVEVLAVDDLV